MSSGLRIRAPQDPDYDPSGPYPDHLYLYTGGVDSFHYAATRPAAMAPQHSRPLSQHRSGADQLSDPASGGKTRRGIPVVSRSGRCSTSSASARCVIETDPFGNFLGQGYEVGSGRDWARLGNLYLQDGVWNGERILPKATRSSSARWHPLG